MTVFQLVFNNKLFSYYNPYLFQGLFIRSNLHLYSIFSENFMRCSLNRQDGRKVFRHPTLENIHPLSSPKVFRFISNCFQSYLPLAAYENNEYRLERFCVSRHSKNLTFLIHVPIIIMEIHKFQYFYPQ